MTQPFLSRLIYSKSQGFRLGGSRSSYVPSAQSEEQAAVSVNKALLSIDYTSMSKSLVAVH